MSNASLKSILIVGGGAAGWLTAGVIAARYGKAVDICLIESSDIPVIGVGEGSWPSLRNTLRDMGISETAFFRECDASFKQGVKFIDWQSEQGDFFYHPFTLPVGFMERNAAGYWLHKNAGQPFADAVCSQQLLCENYLAPRDTDAPDYQSYVNYGYHLDAGKFIDFLRRHCKEKLGVRHTIGTITQVHQSDKGIEKLDTADQQTLTADLYIDCSGLRSLLLGETLGARFIDKSEQIFIDRALAVQLPYTDETEPILPYTVSHAQHAGWIWDIGLYTRRGIGHVYSSRHQSDEEALQVLGNYVGKGFEKLTPRQLHIPCGHRETFWIKNCVGVGMAAGFIEPLEASALVMVELAAGYIRDQLPGSLDVMPIVARRFNRLQTARWNSIVDFLKLHYVLSRRQSDFWQDNRRADSIPESLQEVLDLWRYQLPYKRDFPHKEEMFPVASYQYVLYGMGFRTHSPWPYAPADENVFARQFAGNEAMKQHLAGRLPDTRSLLAFMRR